MSSYDVRCEFTFTTFQAQLNSTFPTGSFAKSKPMPWHSESCHPWLRSRKKKTTIKEKALYRKCNTRRVTQAGETH